MGKKRKRKPGRRPRRSTKKPVSHIEYPSPKERRRIVEQRSAIYQQMTAIVTERMVTGYDQSDQINKLVRKYGSEQVTFVLERLSQMKRYRGDFIAEEAGLYRDYRRLYAHYGGEQPFFDRQAYEALNWEFTLLLGKRLIKQMIPVTFLGKRPSARERELYELLLKESDLWEDITPPAVPPRPPDFSTSTPAVYQPPVLALLEWGWQLNDRLLAQKRDQWRSATPELIQVILDDGLRDGWPGEKSSWAPYHALLLLGYLGAHQHAGTLLMLMNWENDWLSDKLPDVWAGMGSQAEPPLWAYVRDSTHDADDRAVALKGLKQIASKQPQCKNAIIAQMTQLLAENTSDEATLNGYIIFLLNQMEAVSAAATIHNAFSQDKVDTKIMMESDVDFLHPS